MCYIGSNFQKTKLCTPPPHNGKISMDFRESENIEIHTLQYLQTKLPISVNFDRIWVIFELKLLHNIQNQRNATKNQKLQTLPLYRCSIIVVNIYVSSWVSYEIVVFIHLPITRSDFHISFNKKQHGIYVTTISE